MSAPAYIVGASCRFASGPGLPLADVAMRAHLALPSRHPFYVDRGGARTRVNAILELTPDYSATRWCALARMALDELADTLAVEGMLPRHREACALWLLLPPADRAGVPADVHERLRLALQDERFGWAHVHICRGGHAAGVLAMQQAASHEAGLGIVLAVDSWGHPQALQWLEEHRLLHGAQFLHEGRLRANAYGRVPGEAAAAVALAPGRRRSTTWSLGRRAAGEQRPPANPWGLLAGTSLAEEAVTFDKGSQACLGKGLIQAALGALDAARLPPKHIAVLGTDYNGEPYRGDEFGFTVLGLADQLADSWRRSAPALVSGDVGACSAVLHVALAAYRMHRECAARQPTESRLILCSSDDRLRAAAVLTSVTP